MASFNTAYGLCSLVDQKGLLHVSEDEPGCAVVTQGRNSVIRYQLSDQKELNSWSSVQKLSSKVIYHDGVYYGVFNGNVIRSWSKNDVYLEKVRKIKCKKAVYSVLLCENQLIVVFNTGYCVNLPKQDKIVECKKGFLNDDENISEAYVFSHLGVNYLAVVGSLNEVIKLYCVALKTASNEVDLSTLQTYTIERRHVQLLGYCFMDMKSGHFLLTLWSDGFLFQLSLPLDSKINRGQNPGQFISTLRFISKVSQVAMTGLNQSLLALYGGDPSDEGALLVIYNLNFAMVQAQTPFKLLQKPPRIWHLSGRLLIALGQRLVCVPYSLGTGSMASLVGTRSWAVVKGDSNEVMSVVPIVDWDTRRNVDDIEKKVGISIPKNINLLMEDMISQGCSEAIICRTVMGSLLEKKDFTGISWCLENFMDIPEEICVDILNAVLSTNNLDNELIKKIMNVPVDETVLASCLRSLTFNNVLLFLTYLTNILSDGEDFIKTLLWTSAMFDAFYQQFVLSRDTQVLDAIVKCKEQIDQYLNYLTDVKNLYPLIIRLSNGKDMPKKSFSNKCYSIERIQLYE